MSTSNYRSDWDDLPSNDGVADGSRVPRSRRSPAFGADSTGPAYDSWAESTASAAAAGHPAGPGADHLDNLEGWTQLQGEAYGQPEYPAYTDPAAAMPAQPTGYEGAAYGGAAYDAPGYDGAAYDGAAYDGGGYGEAYAPAAAAAYGAGPEQSSFGDTPYQNGGYDQGGYDTPARSTYDGGAYAPDAYAADAYAADTYAAPAPVATSAYAPQPPSALAQPSRQAPEPTSLLAESEMVEEALPQRVHAESKVSKGGLVLADLLGEVLERKASDLHLTVDSPPLLRVRGELVRLEDYPTLTGDMIQEMMYGVLTQRQRETFEEHLELDLAYSLGDLARFRVNLYKQKNAVGSAMRLIPYEIKPLEELGVPASVAQFASLPRGFVLVTGPTGSGKSTTLASLVDLANRTRKDHILTVEDPIEFVHNHKGCIVNQREVGEDTHSFAQALKHALRQDPDIILVGELRDLETIGVALTAAETGHLVFATLHTQNAPQTVERIIDVYPSHQQEQVRAQLAGALQGVVTQTLCKTADGSGRAVATEVMVATPAIRNLIREGKTHQIHSSMQAGAAFGMHTLDQHLAELVKTGRVGYETALEKCTNPSDLARLLGRG